MSNFPELKREEARLAAIEAALDAERGALDEARAARVEVLDRWSAVRKELLDAHHAAARKVGRKLDGRLRAQVAEGGLLELLRGLLETYTSGSGRTVALDRWSECETLYPYEIASAIREGEAALIERYRMTPTAARCVAAGSERLALAIEAVEPAPEAVVSLNVAGRDEPALWKTIDSLSAGQKATAALLMLLRGHASPLVIDQPEDDLDNRYLVHTIVPTIREEKLRRQLLFSTHNANVPVLGDAEQIVCLMPTATNGVEHVAIPPEVAGSIDNIAIRTHVSELLEGGQEAFDLRKTKYGF